MGGGYPKVGSDWRLCFVLCQRKRELKMKSKFYIDNATPVEMSYTLLCINKDEELNNKDFLERFSEKGFAVTRNIQTILKTRTRSH